MGTARLGQSSVRRPLSCRVARGAWLACLFASLSACPSPPDRATVVEFWALGSEGEQVQSLLGDFERENPGVTVRVQQIPWSAAHEKLLTAFIGDAMPDVFQAGNTWLPELVALKAIAPLDERIDSSSVVDRDDFFAGALDATRIAGVGHAVPWYVDTRLLFYRKDLLRAAGYAKPPRTWDSWLAAMRRIRARGGADSRPILLPVNEWEAPVIFALQNGAALLRDGGRYGDFRGKEFRAAFDLYLDLFREDLATPPGAQVNNPYVAFGRGEFCFYLSGPWSIGELRRRWPASMQAGWATMPLPSHDGTYPGVSIGGGASLAMFSGSRQQDAAWKLIEYLVVPETQRRFQRLTGDLPARKSAWSADLRGNGPERAFWVQMQSVRATPKVAEWERIAQTIARHGEAAIRGMESSEEALVALDAEVDALLEKRRWLLDAGRLPDAPVT
jgi:multiple sugar transport system substrate-binding protein